MHLVTGGSGFIGAALVAELLEHGHAVRVLDDQSRGRSARLSLFADAIQSGRLEIRNGDVRDATQVLSATTGCEVVWHLAYVNGTRYFYEKPDLVLEVGIKGALNTLEAALTCGVQRYVLASTSEVYNQPSHVPTTETERLLIPDVKNPRFSYGGGKIASELLALHLGAQRGLETVIFRPHNVYGPDMGFEHVIPEIIERIVELSHGLKLQKVQLPIQGDGRETRSFCYIHDAARGAYLAGMRGSSREIYHLGTELEISIHELVTRIGQALHVELEILPGAVREGGTSRRCPSIQKLRQLGYEPKVDLSVGLETTARWYAEHFMSLIQTR
jgi:nucleoside-diphosphate-sugar epimerase